MAKQTTKPKKSNPVIERKRIGQYGPVNLIQRTYKNGDKTLYLEKNVNGKREYEFLKEYKIHPPKNDRDKILNAQNLERAKMVAAKRSHEISSGNYGLTNTDGQKTIMIEWMQEFINKYDKSDKRNLQGALNRFKDTLAKHKLNLRLTFAQFDSDILKKYIDHLKKNSQGEGAASYYARFRKMMKVAREKDLFVKNPFQGIRPKFNEAEDRDILSMEEIRLLKSTPCNSDVVRRAALFTCVTGFAWIDVKNLTWEMIDTKKWTVRKPRQKTNSRVFINLNATAIEMVGEPGKKDENVFNLPSANGCNKTLSAWVERAGIEKEITWHNLRHSFGTNLAHNGTPLMEIKELMGHKVTRYTERYVKASQEIMQRATDNLTI